MTDISGLIGNHVAEVIALRRDFHRHPELGLEEWRTSQKVMDYLEDCGIQSRRLYKTGVVGLLSGGKPGPTLMLRADLDALPVQEETEVPYKSIHSGVMHACGHDAHMAMLLTAARILSELKSDLAGQIKFVFQPNEEHVGALAMIQEGVLEAPRVDACLGMHIWTPLRTGQLGVAEGPIMAGMEHFRLIIQGQGGHTATPHSAIDPILTAAAVIQGVQVIQTREIDALKEPTIIMFGQIQGGTAANIIPESVTLTGTMRYMFAGHADSEDNPKRRFERVVADICRAYRARHHLEFLYGHPTVVNHPRMVDLVRSVATKELPCRLELVPVVTLVGEDFSEFSSRIPGAFYFLGAGNTDKRTDYPHHHPRFNVDEDALILGVEMQVKTALAFGHLDSSL